MSERIAEVKRQTGETSVELRINLDGSGQTDLKTGLGFLNHMFVLIARHGKIDLSIQAEGDLDVDDHHLTEDLGIVFGRALAQALEDKRGIERYGFSVLPMDEVLVAAAIDLSGRFAFHSDYRPRRERVGDLSTEMVHQFFNSLASEARMNLHFRFLRRGNNEHHRVEAMFKGFARALRMAVRIDPGAAGDIPSSKGAL